jgi:iron complex outermembrane receptor protein
VQFFTNAVDTKTQGLDIVALYDWNLGHGSTLGFDAAADFNKTEVAKIKSSSSILPAAVLFDRSQVTLVEEGQPRQHFVVGSTFRRSGWNANLRFNYFGKVAGEGFTPRPANCSADFCAPGAFKQTWGGKWLADVSLTAPITKDNVSFTVGALNVFNTKPDKWECQDPTNPDACKAFPFPSLGFTYGWETLPFGINGGYYYARINVRFKH